MKPETTQKRAELTSSLEDYLEAIYHLQSHNQGARVKEIARVMDVKMPSVTGALRALVEKGLVKHDPYHEVRLTQEGVECAESIVERHTVIKRFLVEILGLADTEAEGEACRLEHAMKPETLDRLVTFLKRAEEIGARFNGSDWNRPARHSS
ncbi:MAG: metal-dependent transcriptional regulator [Armatimonadota bacterium]|nr:metal-dependent transcriptional regulator [Armatimonadota bacterium]